MNYTEAVAKLGAKTEKKIGNNTRLVRQDDGSIAVVLHYTKVVIIHEDGTYTLSSGGWKTVTTKERINKYSPASVYQKKYEWFVHVPGQLPWGFHDGMKVSASGAPV